MDSLEAKMSKNSSKYAWHLIGKASHLLFWVRQRELTPYNILPRQAYILSLLYNLDHKATLDESSQEWKEMDWLKNCVKIPGRFY
jgi:hypothetical protein